MVQHLIPLSASYATPGIELVVGAAQLTGATYHMHEPALQTHGWASSPLESALLRWKPTQVNWVWPRGISVRDTWDFALLGAVRIKRHTQKPPCDSMLWRKLKVQSAVLPCALARSRLLTTPPRLWLAAPLTVTVQRAASKKGTTSDVLPGALEYFKTSMAMYSMKTCTGKPGSPATQPSPPSPEPVSLTSQSLPRKKYEDPIGDK